MTKRQKFVLSSGVLTLGFFLIQFVESTLRYQAIAILTLLSLSLSIWSLRGFTTAVWAGGYGRLRRLFSLSFKRQEKLAPGIEFDATLLTLVLPTFFTAGVGLFYFLLPSNILTRIPVLVLYAIGMYALLLTLNIYTVATERTIALLRAAHAVGFVLTLVASFLLFDTVLSLRLGFWENGLFAGALSFPLLLQGFWSVELERELGREILRLSAGVALIVGEIASIISFWPITIVVASLALTTVMYVGLGLGQAQLQQRLFSRTIKEYLLVGAIVFVTMFLTARWGG